MLYSNGKSRKLRNGPVFLHLVQTRPNGPVWMGPFLAKTVWSSLRNGPHFFIKMGLNQMVQSKKNHLRLNHFETGPYGPVSKTVPKKPTVWDQTGLLASLVYIALSAQKGGPGMAPMPKLAPGKTRTIKTIRRDVCKPSSFLLV